MWTEATKNGKIRFIERYTDYMTGKEKRVSVTLEKNTAATRKLAAKALSQMIEERQREPEPVKEMTFAELIDAYRKYQKLTVVPSSYRRDCFASDALKKILGGDVLVNRLTPRYIRECFLRTGEAPGTLNERRTRLLALINWAYKNDYIQDSQYVSITKKFENFKDRPHREKIEDKYLEPPELSKLLQGMSVDKWRLLTKFLALSGLRCGEAIALEMADVDFKEKCIHVTKDYDSNNKIVNPVPKNSTSIRDVYIQPQLEAVCREIITNTRIEMMAGGFRTKLFICDSKGGHVHYYAYNKYLKEHTGKILGRRLTTHALRHTHTSLLAAEGVELETISRRLGHADSKTTKDVYLHITKQLREKDNAKVERVRIAGI